MLTSGCAQKVDNPAKVEAIEKALDDYVKAANATDADGLVRLEREWGEASVKRDMATLDRILTAEFQANYASAVGNKKPFLANERNDTSKIDSMAASDMMALVFGDTAIVRGLSTVSSSKAGKDASSQERFTDVFAKRDGRWQCVTGYSRNVE